MSNRWTGILGRQFAIAITAVFWIVCPCWGQGGRGGGGGFGGGIGGGRGGMQVDGDLATHTHILTPGDRGEWPISAKAGETIIVHVTSAAFDPAVEVVGPDNKVIAQNDDVRPGEQDSLVLVSFPKPGDYKVLVKGFKSAGGGQYTISFRRFIADELSIGKRAVGSLVRASAKWHRFSVEAGQTMVASVLSASFTPDLQIYGPSGEMVEGSPYVLDSSRSARTVFRAPSKGAYFARISSGQGSPASYAIAVAAASVRTLTIGAANAASSISDGGLDIWTFKGTAGELVRLDARSAGAPVKAVLEYLPPLDKAAAEVRHGAMPQLVGTMPSDPKSNGEVIASLKQTGNYQVAVWQLQGRGTSYSMNSSHPARVWPAGAETGGSIVLGGGDLWLVDAKAGEVMRFEGSSTQFDAVLELFNSRGERLEINDDGGGNRNALITALATETGKQYVRVSAFGDGGSGAYKLRRTLNPVHAVKIGEHSKGTVGSGGSDIWSFTAKAGETVILSVRSQEFDTMVKLFGPDGLELSRSDDSGESTDSLLSAKLPANGTYTIWVSPKSGGGSYSIQLIEAQ